MSEAAVALPRPLRRCLICRRSGYWVQNAAGDVFFVTHDGRRWCPLRAHKPTTKRTKKRRK